MVWLEVGGEGLVADEEAGAAGGDGAVELDGLILGVPDGGAERGGGLRVCAAGGRVVDGGAVDAGEGDGELFRDEGDDDVVRAERGPVAADGGEVDGEGDVGEGAGVAEVEGGDHGEGVLQSGEVEVVVGGSLEGVVGCGLEREVLRGELRADIVSRLAEVEIVPGGLGGCGGGGEGAGEEEKWKAHGYLHGKVSWGSRCG
jgi:hypothetical protein